MTHFLLIAIIALGLLTLVNITGSMLRRLPGESIATNE